MKNITCNKEWIRDEIVRKRKKEKRRKKVDTAQTMAYSDNYKLSLQLQTVKTAADCQDNCSNSVRQSFSQSGIHAIWVTIIKFLLHLSSFNNWDLSTTELFLICTLRYWCGTISTLSHIQPKGLAGCWEATAGSSTGSKSPQSHTFLICNAESETRLQTAPG